jgi:hypothetical protein
VTGDFIDFSGKAGPHHGSRDGYRTSCRPWASPEAVQEVDLEDGPVLVTVEYLVDAHEASAFVHAMQEYEHVRRRDGASRWGLYHDTEVPDRYVETFLVGSWAEHLRQHARLTQADRKLEDRVYSLVRDQPRVRHLIDAGRTVASGARTRHD